MPLPNYGYNNKEKKERQELKFQMAPEIVDDPDDYSLGSGGRKESRKKGRVTTGTIGIDLERKLQIHQEKDANVWKPPEIDRAETEEIQKYKKSAHQNMRREVKSALDSLISGNKAKQLQTSNKKDDMASPLPRLTPTNNAFEAPKSSFGNGREITKTGISIQPKGAYKLASKKSLGTYSDDFKDNSSGAGSAMASSRSSYSTYDSNDGGSAMTTTRSSFSSYSMSSSSSFKY